MNIQDDTPRKACQDRRNQVLDAATDCFCSQGFHGASIASISKSAGMSAGHIYHYFENKEAIIAAIVDRDLKQVMSHFEQVENAEDVLQALLNSMPHGIDIKLDRRVAALKLEVLAEAARNEKIAQMLQRTEHMVSTRFMSVLKSARRDLAVLSEDELKARSEALSALFNGIMVRGVLNPDIDRAALIAVLEPIIRSLIAG